MLISPLDWGKKNATGAMAPLFARKYANNTPYNRGRTGKPESTLVSVVFFCQEKSRQDKAGEGIAEMESVPCSLFFKL
jgi:hypothetical protein